MIDVAALSALIEDAVRRALDERRPEPSVYLSVGRAAEVAEVSSATIRKWIDAGRLGRYRAGRELRVKRSELDALLTSGWDSDKDTDEALASRALSR